MTFQQAKDLHRAIMELRKVSSGQTVGETIAELDWLAEIQRIEREIGGVSYALVFQSFDQLYRALNGQLDCLNAMFIHGDPDNAAESV